MANKKAYNPMAYTQVQNPGVYRSAYSQRLSEGIRDLANARKSIQNFQYNPLKDANYQALAQVYGARGNQAARDTLGDAAALNGGQQTSFAVSAAQQARNQYNQELAALVPDLSQQAYNRLTTNYGMLQDSYNLWNDLDDKAYGRFRDRVADYQWGRGYDTDVYQYKIQQALNGLDPSSLLTSAIELGGGGSSGGGGGSSGGGGGGRSYSGGGGGGTTSGNKSSGGAPDYYSKAEELINGKSSSNPNSVMAYQTSKKNKKVSTSYPKK